MSQSGTATIGAGATANVGAAPGALSVGSFTNTGPLPVTISGVTGAPVTLQPGQSAAVQVPNGNQVTATCPAPPPGTSGASNPGIGGGGAAPPSSTTVAFLIGTVT